MTLLEAAAALRSRKASSVELTEECLTRIAELNPKLNAFLTVTADAARERACKADEELARGVDRGPLHGIPIGLKDVFETEGIRTTCGSKLFQGYVPVRSAAVAEKLAAAGSVLLGKLNMHELAYGITSNNPHFGAVHNPWNTERVPGGSSGGSGCAVASGMAYMAMGSDTGGSVRIPAAFCGTVGLKPTFGRVSRYGVLPLDFSLDHMGPLTRTVRDAAVTLQAIAGYDPRDETSSRRVAGNYLPPDAPSLKGLRIGLPENFYNERVDPAAAEGLRVMAQAAESLGAVIKSVRVPDIAALNAIGRVILLAEASAAMERFSGRREDFGVDVRVLLDQGALLPATDYINAQRARRLMIGEFRELFGEIDCLFTPTVPIAAPRIGQASVRIGDVEEDARLAATRFVRGINVLGAPALSIPCAFDSEGMPLGLQIVGRWFEEETILRVGAAIESAVSLKSPPLPGRD